MKPDPILADVRKTRDEISERFGGDLAKIFDFFKQQENRAGNLVKKAQNRKKPSAPPK